jgi:hypothetical protein
MILFQAIAIGPAFGGRPRPTTTLLGHQQIRQPQNKMLDGHLCDIDI